MEKKEGELQKHAKTIRRIYDDTNIWKSIEKEKKEWSDINPFWDMEKYIPVKILDEAKQDFPSCSKCQFYLKDKECCPFSALGENCCPKTDWLKKWFGEAEK